MHNQVAARGDPARAMFIFPVPFEETELGTYYFGTKIAKITGEFSIIFFYTFIKKENDNHIICRLKYN